MNQTARKKLIETARFKGTISYSDLNMQCELGFDLSTSYGRSQISELLDDISKNEMISDRPLLSSLVVFKGSKNKYGNGFYTLLEEYSLSKNDIPKLKNSCYDFWRNEDNYRKFG